MAGRVRWSHKRLKEGLPILLLFIMAWILVAVFYRTDDMQDMTSGNARSLDTNKEFEIDEKSAPVRVVEKDSQEYRDGFKYSVDRIQFTTVLCGNRLAEATVMLKSAVLFTRAHIHLHIFIEDNLKEPLLEKLNRWPVVFKKKISITLHEVSYPSHVNSNEWKSVYRPCSSQRIFFPELLPDHDAIMYTDTDIVFLRPLDDFWRLMVKFNSTQLMLMAPATLPGSKETLYNTKTKIPFYGKAGVNSGALLMNLTRMRTVGLPSSLIQIYHKYKSVFIFGDQDMFNIYFHFHPDQLFLATCAWNWRDYHCKDAPGLNLCHDGIAAFHAYDGMFHNDVNPPFKAVYDAFENWTLGTDIEKGLITGLQERFKSYQNLVNYNCTRTCLVDVVSEIRESNSKCLFDVKCYG